MFFCQDVLRGGDFPSLSQRVLFEGAEHSLFTLVRLPHLCSHPRMC
jgi:hypothetical protein